MELFEPKLYVDNNSAKLYMDKCNLYFSYNTLIAFWTKGQLYISQNEWGSTTGKHLNKINDDHKIRIPHAEVIKKYNELILNRGGDDERTTH